MIEMTTSTIQFGLNGAWRIFAMSQLIPRHATNVKSVAIAAFAIGDMFDILYILSITGFAFLISNG